MPKAFTKTCKLVMVLIDFKNKNNYNNKHSRGWDYV